MNYAQMSVGVLGLLAGSAFGQTGTLLAELVPGTVFQNGSMGHSIDIDGNIVVVGSPGEIENSGNIEGRVNVFDISNPTVPYEIDVFDDLLNDQNFGVAVGVSGDIVIVGTRHTGDSPANISAVTFFDLSNGTRSAPVVEGIMTSSQFGSAVAINSTTALVGALWTGDVLSGPVGSGRFVGVSSPHTVSAPMVSPTPTTEELFGYAVALSDSFAFVGAPSSYDAGENLEAGEVNVYNFSGAFQRRLSPMGGQEFDYFGFSIAADNADRVLVGAPYSDEDGPNSDSGAAYLFRASDGAQLQKYVPNDAANNDFFGYDVEIAGPYAIISAPSADYGQLENGSVYIFDLLTGTQVTKINSPVGSDGVFGSSIAASGPNLVVGASGSLFFGFSGLNPEDGGAYVFDLRCSDADLAPGYGELDNFDLTAFTTAFMNMDPVADFNDDGVFDFFDISTFLGIYSMGCP